MQYRYIVVEGSIGSGKSDLSRRLAEHFDYLHLTESAKQNPFLMQFYQNNANHGLATELDYLLRRSEAVETINAEEEKGGGIVADFLLEKDQIFVPAVLNTGEQNLFWALKRKIMPQYPVPDLVIYLQTSDDADIKRLQKKMGGEFKTFPPAYLKQVQEEYRRFFHLYQHSPLLIANADELDYAGNDEHFSMLLSAMSNMRGSRNYLNLSEK